MLCGLVFSRLNACCQGTFQNLDFEQANLVFLPDGLILVGNAFPGWTILANGVSVNFVQVNSVLLQGAGIEDTHGELAPLDGKFSALLAGPGLWSVPVGISQSGTIPAGSESLTFFAIGRFSASFAGHALPLEVLGDGPNNSVIYGADISAYAGDYGQLLFQTGYFSSQGLNILDDITFSTQSIPEPDVLPIFGLGILILGFCRSRRAVSALASPSC